MRYSLSELPEEIRNRIAVNNNICFVSNEVKKDSLLTNTLLNFLNTDATRRVEFVGAAEFDEYYARFTARSGIGENDLQQLAIDMIRRAYDSGATDIHICDWGTHTQVKFRVLGMLRDDIDMDGVTGRRMIRAIYEHLGAAQDSPAFDVISRLDGRIVNRDYLPQGLHSIRIHVEPIEVEGGENGRGSFMPLRLIRDTSGAEGTLEERLGMLGYTNQDIEIVNRAGETRHVVAQTKLFRGFAARTGIVFIAGCTGSGKSTALSHCMKALIKEKPTDNFISIEDPPEQAIPGMYQMPVNSKKGEDRATAYTDAIAGTNRDDPDTVMIGEIRYAEAALATIDVALSGNQVWTTIHAADAIGIIQRLDLQLRSLRAEPLNMICDPTVVSGLVFQRLVPKLCPQCKRPLRENRDELPDDLLDRLRRTMPEEIIFGDSTHDGLFVRGHGCDLCQGSGHPGLLKQTIIAEVIPCNPHILELFRNRKNNEAKEYWLKELHGMTYLEHARHLLANGIIGPRTTEDMMAMPIDADIQD